MVEAGFGLALVPESSVDEELRAGTLQRLGSISAMIPVVLIQRRRGYLSGAMRALRALLLSEAAEPPVPKPA
jgi:DNA-binding transcriptional LysR family regulator